MDSSQDSLARKTLAVPGWEILSNAFDTLQIQDLGGNACNTNFVPKRKHFEPGVLQKREASGCS